MKLLNEYTNDLEELQTVDFTTYVENKLIHRTVEQALHLAVEACLDTGQQIIAQEGFRIPEDNKDVFIVLSEEDAVPNSLFPNLIAMAKFRNLIVHDYARIDNQVIFGVLKEQLGDLNTFAQATISYLKPR